MAVLNTSFSVTTLTGSVIDIESNYILFAAANGSGCDIIYDLLQQGPRKIQVAASAASIATSAGNLIAVTHAINGALVYINGDKVVEIGVNGTGSIIKCDKEAMGLRQFTVNESVATVRGLINALNVAGEGALLAGNNAFTGSNSFSQPIIYSEGGIAAAGTTQGTATAITAEETVLTAVTTGATGAILPVPVIGAKFVVKHAAASLYSALIYPTGTNTINGGSASAPVSLGAGGTKTFIATSATNWEVVNSTVLYTQQISLTNTQVLALNGTAIPIVRATGVTTEAIVPVSATMAYTRGAASYATNTELDLIHSGSSNALLKTSIAGAASTFAPFINAVSATPSGNVFIANADMNIFVPTGNPTGGDAGSSIKVTVVYALVSVI